MTDRFPQEFLTMSKGIKDGFLSVANINISYCRYTFCSDYPWLFVITVPLGEKQDTGLPTVPESRFLEQLQTQLDTGLREVAQVHYIARQTWNGYRYFDYYTSDRDSVNSYLQELKRSNSLGREFSFNVQFEPNWESWMPTLNRFDD